MQMRIVVSVSSSDKEVVLSTEGNYRQLSSDELGSTFHIPPSEVPTGAIKIIENKIKRVFTNITTYLSPNLLGKVKSITPLFLKSAVLVWKVVCLSYGTSWRGYSAPCPECRKGSVRTVDEIDK